jgi:hypothetical protein
MYMTIERLREYGRVGSSEPVARGRTRQEIQQFYVDRGSLDWNESSPQAKGMTYAEIFAEGVCRAIPGCITDADHAHAARMDRIKDGLRTLWPAGPIQMLQEYNAVIQILDTSMVLPTSGPNMLPLWEDPFWQAIRLVMRLHAASEAPADLLDGTHKVSESETPMMIAALYTGEPLRYQELVDANPQIPTMELGSVGRGPGGGGHRNFSSGHFRPGMQLNVPGPWRSSSMYRPREIRYVIAPTDPYTYEYRGLGYPPGTPNSLKRLLTKAQFLAEANKEVGPQRAKTFLAAMQSGDEIWYYNNMGWMGILSGAIGYYLLRGGRVVADLVIAVS